MTAIVTTRIRMNATTTIVVALQVKTLDSIEAISGEIPLIAIIQIIAKEKDK